MASVTVADTAQANTARRDQFRAFLGDLRHALRTVNMTGLAAQVSYSLIFAMPSILLIVALVALGIDRHTGFAISDEVKFLVVDTLPPGVQPVVTGLIDDAMDRPGKAPPPSAPSSPSGWRSSPPGTDWASWPPRSTAPRRSTIPPRLAEALHLHRLGGADRSGADGGLHPVRVGGRSFALLAQQFRLARRLGTWLADAARTGHRPARLFRHHPPVHDQQRPISVSGRRPRAQRWPPGSGC